MHPLGDVRRSGRAQPGRQQAIGGGGRSPALDVAQDGHPRLQAGGLLQRLCQVLGPGGLLEGDEHVFQISLLFVLGGLQLGPDFGPPTEIWVRENLLERWNFPPEIGTAVGTGLTDEVAAALPIPARAEVLGYLRRSYGDLESFVALLDERYPGPDSVEPALAERIGRIRLNILNFLTHDGRHLGMMEVLKGLQTGFGSATETR